MVRTVDMMGWRFGRLVVTGRAEARNGRTQWRCSCDCGSECVVRAECLRAEVTKSCGCLSRERAAEGNSTHGHSRVGKRTKAYHAWASMIKRCTNPHICNWSDYGGRGIVVCDRWRDFVAFHADMGEPPSPQHSLDRIEVDGNYEPGNCRWATPEDQASNRRTSVLLTMDGQTMTLEQWGRATGIKSKTISSRIKQGWTVEDALCTP
jgi:hypothetical protein